MDNSNNDNNKKNKKKSSKKNKKRKSIIVAVDEQIIIDARKVLFSKGLGVQNFFSFILNKVSTNHPIALELVDLASEERINDKLEKQSGMRKADDFDAELLYKLIEEGKTDFTNL